MRTVNVNLYCFDELSKEARERVVEDLYRIRDFPWWDEWLESLRFFCKEMGVPMPDVSVGGRGEGVYWRNGRPDARLSKEDQVRSCEMSRTGYCGDASLVGDTVVGAVESWWHDCKADWDYTMSREAIEEDARDMGEVFTSDGRIY